MHPSFTTQQGSTNYSNQIPSGNASKCPSEIRIDEFINERTDHRQLSTAEIVLVRVAVGITIYL